MTTDLHHAPNCGDHEGTSVVVGQSSTITRCLRCGAVAVPRHVHPTPTPTRTQER